MHKFSRQAALPTKDGVFDWTLGEIAVQYGRESGYDYALFLYARDSFASNGRVALQAVGYLGCMVGVCAVAPGGSQTAFASLVDLKISCGSTTCSRMRVTSARRKARMFSCGRFSTA
jgi:hypothetical protein